MYAEVFKELQEKLLPLIRIISAERYEHLKEQCEQYLSIPTDDRIAIEEFIAQIRRKLGTDNPMVIDEMIHLLTSAAQIRACDVALVDIKKSKKPDGMTKEEWQEQRRTRYSELINDLVPKLICSELGKIGIETSPHAMQILYQMTSPQEEGQIW